MQEDNNLDGQDGPIQKITGEIVDHDTAMTHNNTEETVKPKTTAGGILEGIKDAFNPNSKDSMIDTKTESGPRKDSGEY